MNDLSHPFKRDFSLDGIEEVTTIGPDGVVGNFYNLDLHSHFQPIISLAHHRVVGYEGLLRPRSADGQAQSPSLLFDTIETNDDIVFLDRLARNIHVRNFVAAGLDEPWLFLNVNARVAMSGKEYGAYFKAMLERHGLAPHRVVLELVENEIRDEGMLAEAMQYYRELGCLVAIDDFGAGQSNFERIWHVQPHIVKIDRSTLIQANSSRKFRRVLPSLVALLHESGCLTLLEGIENETEAMIALDAGVDFVQGFYYARPARDLNQAIDSLALLGAQMERQALAACAIRTNYHAVLEPYLEGFSGSADAMAFDADSDEVTKRLLTLPKVLRCYLLDGKGKQLGDNIQSALCDLNSDPRFYPVANPVGATWTMRPYFQRAMADPGNIQISRPYFSITDASLCITLSVRLKNANDEDRVCCMDIMWEDEGL